ncbi:peptidase M50, partial [Fischerella thermalis WC217]
MRESKKENQSLLANEAPPEVERMGLTWLIGAAIATIILWQVPAG